MKYHRAHICDNGANLGISSIGYVREPSHKLPTWQNNLLATNKDVPDVGYYETAGCMSQGFYANERFFTDSTFKEKRLTDSLNLCYGKTYWFFENHGLADHYINFYLYTLTSEEERKKADMDPYFIGRLPLINCIRDTQITEKDLSFVLRIILEVSTWNVDAEYIAEFKRKEEENERW